MASASRLLRLSSSFSRASRPRSRSISSSLILPSPHPHQHHRRFLLFSLPLPHFLAPQYALPALRCLTTSSAEAEAVAVAVDGSSVSNDEPPALSHPWPEWELFLDKLRVKGYFDATTSVVPSREEGEATVVKVDMEANRVKNACLKFARDRYDIFSSLPREDVQAVVECGCPNIFRKAVNSAKRLRAYMQLDEEHVCNDCNLRGSCDKAYITPTEDEGPRTVDVVRILLTYAINPKHLAGGESSLVQEHVQTSARNLLSELVKLSDCAIDPSIPKPVIQPPNQDKLSQKVTAKHSRASNIEMKRGDWLCPNCNFLNFARNLRCLECKEDGPKKATPGGDAEMKLGDWNCPKCEFMNFARNRTCFRCQDQRPKRDLNPGEWECPSCYYINFRRNQVCKKCNSDRPEGEGNQFDDHAWRSPRRSTHNDNIKFGHDDNVLDNDEDILPLSGENKFVASKRATTAERRLTSARNQSFQ
ncbi:zinc finger protein VAR3, chloroplastic [Canna indica]|uniref:Zinc finger protein VAR3, chloroplastic n=1 Tax=Canna indica TaxID=4628 RepID=A0AAQ3KN12_9LILI|nr:zinc finger protein VAR3, chloroplastic [Canna indica]